MRIALEKLIGILRGLGLEMELGRLDQAQMLRKSEKEEQPLLSPWA